MTDIEVCFHAHPDETLVFVSQWIDAYPIWATVLRSSPFGTTVVQAAPEIREAWPCPRIAFTASEPHLQVISHNEFLFANAGLLMLDVGAFQHNTLKESWLSTRCNDDVAPSIWKQIAKDLRKATKAGAWSMTAEGEHRSRSRNQRYTEGALKLQQNGVRMLPFVGDNILILGP